MQPMTFPNDDTGDALRRLQRDGDPLTQTRDIDFTVIFATEAAAKEFSSRFVAVGYKVFIEETHCKEDLPWDVRLVKRMLPTYEGIRAFENELEEAAVNLGGRNDGWGCFAQNGR